MLTQSLLAPSTERLSGEQLSATDGMLWEYRADADWRAIWSAVADARPDVPPYGIRVYWPPAGPGGAPVPTCTVAFVSTAARLRIARDPLTADSLLYLMAHNEGGDPDATVRAAARR